MQILKKLFLALTTSCHEYPYDTHHGVLINRAKFDACIAVSEELKKTDTQIHRQTHRNRDRQNCALYIRCMLIWAKIKRLID